MVTAWGVARKRRWWAFKGRSQGFGISQLSFAEFVFAYPVFASELIIL